MSGNKKKEEARKERVPLGTPRLRMSVTGRKGYQRRWVNDTAGRLQQAIDGGYSLVMRDDVEFTEPDAANRNDSINDAVSKVVNNDGTKAYLMEIPLGYYTADQKEKAKQIDETEDALKQGMDGHGKPGTDGRYIPREGIKIS